MKHTIRAALAMVAILGTADAIAQPASAVDSHLAAASGGAIRFHRHARAHLHCPQTAPGRDVAPGPAPNRATWFTEPAKVFDNLYFVGTKIHSSWALTTSDGSS